MIEPDYIDNLICVLNEQVDEGYLSKEDALEILSEVKENEG